MKIKIAELTGELLHVAVAMAQDATYQLGIPDSQIVPGTLERCRQGIWQRWTSGVWSCRYCAGYVADRPIIEQLMKDKRISVMCRHSLVYPDEHRWFATSDSDTSDPMTGEFGPSPSTAVFRCVVATCLGDEIEIPDYIVDHIKGKELSP